MVSGAATLPKSFFEAQLKKHLRRAIFLDLKQGIDVKVNLLLKNIEYICKNLLMKRSTNTIARICLTACLLMLLSARVAGQSASADGGESLIDSLDVAALEKATAIMKLSLLPHITAAQAELDSTTGCRLQISSYLKEGADAKKFFSILEAVERMFRQQAESNAINVSIEWEATGTGYDIRTYVSANAGGVFSREALQAFTDSLNDRHSETLTAIVEPKKTHEKIMRALAALQKGAGSYAAEDAGSKDAVRDTSKNSADNKRLQDKIIPELMRDIKSKIRIAGYTEAEKAYLEGAVEHVEYLSRNVILASKPMISITGWYDGRANVYMGNETDDDIKVTIFHEFLHHVNYLRKVYEYRYENEDKRKLYVKPDPCFYFDNQSLQKIYEEFDVTLNNRRSEEGWKNNYSDLTAEQQKEVLAYKKKRTDKCSFGRYRPSNYYRDELTVYTICLKLDRVLYEMSDEKKAICKENINGYEELIRYSAEYESRNNLNANGYEK